MTQNMPLIDLSFKEIAYKPNRGPLFEKANMPIVLRQNKPSNNTDEENEDL